MSRWTPLAVGLLSAGVLAYQVLLVRLFAIIGWSQVAYMMISIALLGFGASGTGLALVQTRVVPRFEAAFACTAALFAVTAVGCFALAMRLPFNPLALIWDPKQLVWLGAGYVALVVPFFCGGFGIGLALTRFRDRIAGLYAADLAGAGLGALGVIAVLFWLSPEGTLRLVAALGLAAAVAVVAPSRAALGLAVVAVAVAAWLPPGLLALTPHVSEYKGLSMALRVPDARVVSERSSPVGWLRVAESPTIPFRHAPGLALTNPVEPPEQLGLFVDGAGPSAITRFDGDLGPLAYLDYTTSALPYHLSADPHVLILGAGGGDQVLLALYHHAAAVDAVELDARVVGLVRQTHGAFAGGLYDRPEVDVHVDEARTFVRRTDRRYDLIQIPPGTSFAAAASGADSVHASHAWTVEALRDYLARLAPGGMLSVTTWLKLPPRDTLKLFATAVEALRRAGVPDPGTRLALIRSWKTATLLVRNVPFGPREIAALKAFARERSFDLAWYPGMEPEEANRFTVLAEPWLYRGASALTGPDAQAFIAGYKFDIRPATDDRPFFFDFFRWRALPELLRLRTQGTAVMLDMSYLVLVATLVQAALLSLLLILAPLAMGLARAGGGPSRWAVTFYFTAVGLGFMLIEIAFIQRFTLFLGHPIYAVAVVLAGFLVFAGAGSALAPRLARRVGGGTLLALVAGGIAVLAAAYIALLPALFDALITLTEPLRIAVALGLIAPLALLMGMPMPLGLSRLAKAEPRLVPWAWGINGCASVVAAVLATLLAMHTGFAVVVLLAGALYLTTPFAGRRLGRRAQPA